MSAQEFGEWITFMQHEQQTPGAERFRHAQLLAAVHNGPLTRHDKALWRVADILPADPWAPPDAEPAPAAPTAAELAAQVDRINALMAP